MKAGFLLCIIAACVLAVNADSVCTDYLGYSNDRLCYSLLRWSVAANRAKIADAMSILDGISQELPDYQYSDNAVDLGEYIDAVNTFTEDCVGQFEMAQTWFLGRVNGCNGTASCASPLTASDFTWSL